MSVESPRVQRRWVVSLAAGLVGLVLLSGCADDPGPHLRRSFADSGPSADVAAIRAAVPGLMQDEEAASALTPSTFASTDSVAVRQANLSPSAVAARRALLDAADVPARAAAEQRVATAAVEQMITDVDARSSLGYTHNTYAVQTFEGISVGGSTAHALFVGMGCYTQPTGHRCGLEMQVYLTLRTTADGWRIADYEARSLPGAEP